MSIVRKAQLLTLILSAGIGLAVLLTLEKIPALSLVDTMLSPEASGSITPGSIVEDPHPEHKRQRVFRKVFAPDNKAPDYLLCSIDDDPDGINAYGIYHPADLAITLRNLRKLKMRSIFITTHLHWPELEQVELNALSTSISEFDYATIATPVRRAIKGEPLPDYFWRSSLPANEVKGNTGSLPRVNKLSLPPNVPIPSNTLAGFSTIESEETDQHAIPLIARWEDRVIFYAPLLEYLQHLGLKPSDLSVEVGKSIRLGNRGNIIPIDEFGQLHSDYQTQQSPFTVTSAYSGEASIIGITQSAAILSADGEKSSDYSSLHTPFNALAQIMHTPTVGGESKLSRFPLWLEVLLIIDLAALAAWLLAYRSARRHSTFIIVLFALCAAIFALNRFTAYWSPSAPYLITLITGWVLTSLMARPVRKKMLATTETTSRPGKDSQKEQPHSPVSIGESAKKTTQSIQLPKPEKANLHTGKPTEHDSEGEFIPEEATMFSNDTKEPSAGETKTAGADDKPETKPDTQDGNAPSEEIQPSKRGITGKVKIDTETEYPYFPEDSEDK